MTSQTTLNHATSGYLLMIAYCIGESIGHQTCNRFRMIIHRYHSTVLYRAISHVGPYQMLWEVKQNKVYLFGEVHTFCQVLNGKYELETTLNHATSGYLLMIAYCIGESIGHQTCNRFRTIWIIYFSGNKTGKWNSIPASVSFYVSPTNLIHLFRDLVDVDIPAEILLDGNPEVFGRFHFF
jgi:hypothetical protein